MRRQAVILGLLACAFLGRVLGQVTVVLLEPDWLPPMQDWYSGLLPYSILLYPLGPGRLSLCLEPIPQPIEWRSTC